LIVKRWDSGYDEAHPQVSPDGWDHINPTDDYVWLGPIEFDAEGFPPLKISDP
jgi:hypothetical protein